MRPVVAGVGEGAASSDRANAIYPVMFLRSSLGPFRDASTTGSGGCFSRIAIVSTAPTRPLVLVEKCGGEHVSRRFR